MDEGGGVTEEVVVELVDRVRKVGVEAVATERELRREAGELARDADGLFAPPLRRIAAAGTKPSYPQYTMSEELLARIRATAMDHPKRCARVVDTLLADLLERATRGEFAPEEPAAFERAIERCRATAQQLAFGYDLAPLLEPAEVQVLMLPESGVPGELVFLRVLQCGDVCFDVGAGLAESAVRSIKLGRFDLPAAYGDLGRLVGLLMLESQLLDVVSSGLTKEEWQQLRPVIEEPSVLQFRAYSSLVERLSEAGRLLPYPRLVGEGPSAEDAERFVADVNALVVRCQSLLEDWFKKHLGVAKTFNRLPPDDTARRYLSRGTVALGERRPRFGTQ